jgi:AsmA protein
MNLTISLDANRAAFGALSIDALSGQARVTPEHVAIEPIRFGVFGGTYDGALTITLGDVPQIHMKAAVAGIDTAAAMAFAERPGAMTGRASGTIDLTGRGTTGDRILDTAQGTVRLEVADGTVKGLSLVRAVVLATSMRQDSKAQLGSTLRDETFSRMGLSAQITSGTAATRDLRFESSDVLFSAAGLVRLDGTSVDLAGDVQLSEALSKQAGRDLYRYTRKDGRVTLPATITGPVDKLQVRLNVGDAAKRAIANKAAEELKKRLRRIIR